NENAGVIYERVDPPKAFNGSVDDALGSVAAGDIAIHNQDIRITGRIDRARVGDDSIADLAEAFHQAGADATRSTSNSDNLLFEGHESLPAVIGCDLVLVGMIISFIARGRTGAAGLIVRHSQTSLLGLRRYGTERADL